MPVSTLFPLVLVVLTAAAVFVIVLRVLLVETRRGPDQVPGFSDRTLGLLDRTR